MTGASAPDLSTDQISNGHDHKLIKNTFDNSITHTKDGIPDILHGRCMAKPPPPPPMAFCGVSWLIHIPCSWLVVCRHPSNLPNLHPPPRPWEYSRMFPVPPKSCNPTPLLPCTTQKGQPRKSDGGSYLPSITVYYISKLDLHIELPCI